MAIVRIPLEEQGDTAIVQQSGAEPRGVIVTFLDSRGKGTNNVDMHEAEWDAFVAAGNAALGRPLTPLEERIVKAIAEADEEADKQAGKSAEQEDLADGRGEGLREALRMVREAGPMVPRAAVAAVAARLARLADVLESDDRSAQREARRVLWKVLNDMKAMLDGAPAPKEPGHADD